MVSVKEHTALQDGHGRLCANSSHLRIAGKRIPGEPVGSSEYATCLILVVKLLRSLVLFGRRRR
jgi:hypothetical protein